MIKPQIKNVISLLFFQLSLLFAQSGSHIILNYSNINIQVISPAEAKEESKICRFKTTQSSWNCLHSKAKGFGFLEGMKTLGYSIIGLALMLFLVQVLISGAGLGNIIKYLFRLTVTVLLFSQIPQIAEKLASITDTSFSAVNVNLDLGEKIKEERNSLSAEGTKCASFEVKQEVVKGKKNVSVSKPLKTCCPNVCKSVTGRTGGYAVCNWACEMQKSSDYLDAMVKLENEKRKLKYKTKDGKARGMANAETSNSQFFVRMAVKVLTYLLVVILFVIQNLAIPFLIMMLYLGGLIGLPLSLMPGNIGGSIADIVKSSITLLIWPLLITLTLLIFLDISVIPVKEFVANIQNLEDPSYSEVADSSAWMSTLGMLIAGPFIISYLAVQSFQLIQGLVSAGAGAGIASGIGSSISSLSALAKKGFDKSYSTLKSAGTGVVGKAQGRDASYTGTNATSTLTKASGKAMEGGAEALARGVTGVAIGAGSLIKDAVINQKIISNGKNLNEIKDGIASDIRSGISNKELSEKLSAGFNQAMEDKNGVAMMTYAAFMKSNNEGELQSRNYSDAGNQDNYRLEGEIKKTGERALASLESGEERGSLKPHLSNKELIEKAKELFDEAQKVDSKKIFSDQQIYKKAQKDIRPLVQTGHEINTKEMNSIEKAAYEDLLKGKNKALNYSSKKMTVSKEMAEKAGYKDMNQMLLRATTEMMESGDKMSVRAGDKESALALNDIMSGKTQLPDKNKEGSFLSAAAISESYHKNRIKELNKEAKSLKAGAIKNIKDGAENGSAFDKMLSLKLENEIQKTGVAALPEARFDELVQESLAEVLGEDGRVLPEKELKAAIKKEEDKTKKGPENNKQFTKEDIDKNTTEYLSSDEAASFVVLCLEKPSDRLKKRFINHCNKAVNDKFTKEIMTAFKEHIRKGNNKEFKTLLAANIKNLNPKKASELEARITQIATESKNEIAGTDKQAEQQIEKIDNNLDEIKEYLFHAGQAGEISDSFKELSEKESGKIDIKGELESYRLYEMPSELVDAIKISVIKDSDIKIKELDSNGKQREQELAKIEEKRDQILGGLNSALESQQDEKKKDWLSEELGTFIKGESEVKSLARNISDAEIKPKLLKEAMLNIESEISNPKDIKPAALREWNGRKLQAIKVLKVEISNAGKESAEGASKSGIDRVDQKSLFLVQKSISRVIKEKSSESFKSSLKNESLSKLAKNPVLKKRIIKEIKTGLSKAVKMIQDSKKNDDLKQAEIKTIKSLKEELIKLVSNKGESAKLYSLIEKTDDPKLLKELLNGKEIKESLTNIAKDKERTEEVIDALTKLKEKRIESLDIKDLKELEKAENNITEKSKKSINLFKGKIKEIKEDLKIDAVMDLINKSPKDEKEEQALNQDVLRKVNTLNNSTRKKLLSRLGNLIKKDAEEKTAPGTKRKIQKLIKSIKEIADKKKSSAKENPKQA